MMDDCDTATDTTTLDVRPPVSKKFLDLTGEEYGDRKVIGFAGFRKKISKWHVECKCGRELVMFGNILRQGRSWTCRCEAKEVRKHPLYRFWLLNIRGGEREVDASWRESFRAFLSDAGERPDGAILCPLDQSKPLGPGNVEWVGRSEFFSRMHSGMQIIYKGRSQNMAEWARELGISRERVRQRLLKYPPEVALSYGKLTDGEYPPGVERKVRPARKRKVGRPRGNPGRPKAEPVRLSREERSMRRKQMRDMASQGYSAKKIAKWFGVTLQTVEKALKRGMVAAEA